MPKYLTLIAALLQAVGSTRIQRTRSVDSASPVLALNSSESCILIVMRELEETGPAQWELQNVQDSLQASESRTPIFLLDLGSVKGNLTTRGHRVVHVHVDEILPHLQGHPNYDQLRASRYPHFWKIEFAKFVLELGAIQRVLVTDIDVVCFADRAGSDVVEAIHAAVPASSSVACGLEAPGYSRKYNTGFCTYRNSPQTVSFLGEVSKEMWRIRDDDQTPFNSVVASSALEETGFVTQLPDSVIHVLDDEGAADAAPQEGLCFHYLGMKKLPDLQQSWVSLSHFSE